MNPSWFEENKGSFEGQVSFDEPLSRHTWYRIGGPARVFVVPKSTSDLEWILRGLRESGLPHFALGMGSNLLVSDEGFDGVVIKATRMNVELVAGASAGGRVLVRAGASLPVSSLLRRAAQEGWGGLEFLTGIPGSLGGAVAMNAGTHLGESRERLRRVEYFDLRSGGMLEAQGTELRFEYRRNLFLPEGAIVWSTDWEAQPERPERVKELIDETLARRKSTQPIDQPSCGSVFKNPREKGISAWQVVDRLGLRGHRIGGAEFSPKHSNFIVNVGGARAEDVRALIELAKARAQAEQGVRLEEEVKYLGRF